MDLELKRESLRSQPPDDEPIRWKTVSKKKPFQVLNGRFGVHFLALRQIWRSLSGICMTKDVVHTLSSPGSLQCS